MSDHALDALLAELLPPPVPAGLDMRAAAAALAVPQEPHPIPVRPRHDRRKSWLRRPLLLGGIALGLAVSGAVAATLAGVRLPLVEAVLAKLPFTEREVPPPAPTPPPPAPVTQAPAPVAPPPVVESRIEAPRAQAPRSQPVPAFRIDPPPAAPPVVAPQRSEVATPSPVDLRPPVLTLPPSAPPPLPIVREPTPAPVERPRAEEAATDARLRQEGIERAERLRAARQAQIERLQRVQQRRERIRRLRRD